ncbi:MAG: hypothetical protein EXX96DRAFT_474477, partial [Benjaminiella poitrasii]
SLQARSLWYRVAHEKVPYQALLFQYNVVNSSSCPLCGGHDTIVHFLVECPAKWQAWNKFLTIHLPILDLQQTDVLQILFWRLQPPLPTDLDHLPTVVSNTLWCIWCNHYHYVFF